MKNRVTIIPIDTFIAVDDEYLRFEFTAPSNIHAIQWLEGKGEKELKNGEGNIPITKEEYAKEIQPYVDLFEKEKARIEELRRKEEEKYNSFEETQKRKIAELASIAGAFESNLNKDMYFISKLKFKVNGDRRTKQNIQDLITFFDIGATGEPKTVAYRDYDNIERKLTKEQLTLIYGENVVNGNNLYAQKWQFEEQIKKARTVQDLNAIKIAFVMTDFSKL